MGEKDSAAASLQAGCGLFFDTTALIRKVMGPEAVRLGIAQTAGEFARLGTSAFARREYDIVIEGAYGNLIGALERIPGPTRARRVDDLLTQAADLTPPRVPGGHTLQKQLLVQVAVRFAYEPVTPRELIAWLEGQQSAALQMKLQMGERRIEDPEIVDASSCCCWGDFRTCFGVAGPDCQLKRTCLDKRQEFLASVRILAEATECEESKWLRDNAEILRQSQGLALLRMVGSRPNWFGDIVIFWEVPDGWTILARDRSFRHLQSQREEVQVYWVRAERSPVDEEGLLLLGDGSEYRVRVRSYSHSGALLEGTLPKVTLREKLHLECGSLGIQHTCTLARRSEGRWHAVRFVKPAGGRAAHGQ